MNSVGFIAHKGKQVLLVDFTDCTPEDVKSVLDEARHIITSQPQNSVLVLADFTGTQFSRDAVAHIKDVAAYDRPYVKRAAWVHRESLQKGSDDAINAFSPRELSTFESREQALEFLVGD